MNKINRRTAITGLAASAIASTTVMGQAVSAALLSNMSLGFRHLHTGESLKVSYRIDGLVVPDALKEINYILRDHRSGDVTKIDIRLLDSLYFLKQKLETEKPFQVISGYRSPRTNAKLARQSNGVAKRSLHMQGRAIDVRIYSKDTRQVYRAARDLGRGGVGLYSRSQFVHLDTGRTRYWGR